MTASRRNTRYALADLKTGVAKYDATSKKTTLALTFTTGGISLVMPNDETKLLDGIATRLQAFKPVG